MLDRLGFKYFISIINPAFQAIPIDNFLNWLLINFWLSLLETSKNILLKK